MNTFAANTSVRARHLFGQIVKTHGITPVELPVYQSQAREVLEHYGADYVEQWLQNWLDLFTEGALDKRVAA